MFNDLFTFDLDDIFNWDKQSYRFNREEKDMHPYSINYGEKEILITHNILGINKEDLKINRENKDNKTFISISGKTKDNITGKEYSVNSRFVLDENELQLDKTQATAKNGLLYITIPVKKEIDKKPVKQQISIL